MTSGRFLDIHEGDVDEEAERDDRGEKDNVPEVDHAARDGNEMGEETKRTDRIHDKLRRPTAEEREDHIQTAGQKEERDRGSDDEGDDLILGQG